MTKKNKNIYLTIIYIYNIKKKKKLEDNYTNN